MSKRCANLLAFIFLINIVSKSKFIDVSALLNLFRQFIISLSQILISEINPATGTFVQLATDASIVGHVIKSLLVYDMVTCARECLMYLNCLSINYEYKTTTSREFRELGMICELNDDTSSDVPIHQRFGFKYYERFNSNSLYYRDR